MRVLQDSRLPRPSTLLCFTSLFANYPLSTIHYPCPLGPSHSFYPCPTKPHPTSGTCMQPGCQLPLSWFSKHEEKEFFAFCTIFGRCSQMRSANGRNNDTVERHRLFCFVREARSTYWPCRFALSLWHLNTLASPTVTVEKRESSLSCQKRANWQHVTHYWLQWKPLTALDDITVWRRV